jgi:hypothetical protein
MSNIPENLGKQSVWLQTSAAEAEKLYALLEQSDDPDLQSLRKKLKDLNTDNLHDEAYRGVLMDKYGSQLQDGDLDLQHDALVANGEDGAYVMAFLHITDEEAGFAHDEPEEPGF